jgi:hypothetical protein
MESTRSVKILHRCSHKHIKYKGHQIVEDKPEPSNLVKSPFKLVIKTKPSIWRNPKSTNPSLIHISKCTRVNKGGRTWKLQYIKFNFPRVDMICYHVLT